VEGPCARTAPVVTPAVDLKAAQSLWLWQGGQCPRV
jgi:hypothetical protein